MSKIKRLPPRTKTKIDDTWDLASLFADDAAWDATCKKWEKNIAAFEKYRGKLASDAKTLLGLLKLELEVDRAGDSLGTYAFLKAAEDQANGDYQRMTARYQSVATRMAQAASFIRPELLAIPAGKMKQWMASKEFAPYKLMLERILRYKPYTLSDKEERLLAMQGEMAQAAGKAFRQLLDADMKFGLVENEKGEQVELGNATLMQLLTSPKRSVRKAAFQQYYAQFDAHRNTLAATLAGSIHKGVYYAKARGYDGALEAALFPDEMPQTVYDNLIATVRKHLPVVHRYYDVRRRKMKLKDIHHYDTYVPILSDLEKKHTWNQAVKVVIESLEPLGGEYCGILEKGLLGRWCDRYPNQGKQSGAFSSGTFDSDPYILMNFKPEVLDDVFTLTHEAGHSMHSFNSRKNQPFQYADYTIFVAEVASTFNEQLLGKHLMERAASDRERAFLINRELDGLRGTLVRQTMFAEFEKATHGMAEAGEPLTVDTFREAYRGLLDAYFGPEFAIDNELSLECFRIPHFYRAFYVYKYATGISAAIALSERVLNGGEKELADYLGFLKAGSSKTPLNLLRDAGVDMEKPTAVETAMQRFGMLVEELDSLLK